MSNTYSKEERLEALKLADEIGPVAAAQRLNINLNTLYNWQSKARKQGITADSNAGVLFLTNSSWQSSHRLWLHSCL